MMVILVAYESQTGHTRRTAEAIATAARAQGRQVVLKPLADVEPDDVQRADVLFLGTWVHGYVLFGVKPAGAATWVPGLPDLAGKPVGVFCSYAFFPGPALRTLSALLQARGATIRCERAFHRSRPADGADEFVRSVVEQPIASLN
jgi:flavodoxin